MTQVLQNPEDLVIDRMRGAKKISPKSSDWPRPQITLRRSLIDKTTPTTPSRQSLIDKPRFGAIPSKRMRIDEFVCTMEANINEYMTMHNPRLHVCIPSVQFKQFVLYA